MLGTRHQAKRRLSRLWGAPSQGASLSRDPSWHTLATPEGGSGQPGGKASAAKARLGRVPPRLRSRRAPQRSQRLPAVRRVPAAGSPFPARESGWNRAGGPCGARPCGSKHGRTFAHPGRGNGLRFTLGSGLVRSNRSVRGNRHTMEHPAETGLRREPCLLAWTVQAC